jgi:hypothetical protein
VVGTERGRSDLQRKVALWELSYKQLFSVKGSGEISLAGEKVRTAQGT